MQRSDAKYLQRALTDFFGVPESATKILTMGEGKEKDHEIYWNEVDANGKRIPRVFADLAECVAYLNTSEDETPAASE